jgi:hypothetical protein
MQFQDITRQKLERLHKPTLGAATAALSLLSHETQALLQRDLYRAVRAYSESAMKPKRDGGEDMRSLDDLGGAPPDEGRDKPQGPDKKVEIF